MAEPGDEAETGADALLLALGRLGISYLFANAGTDFPPVIEGLAKLRRDAIPTPVPVPHETVAIGMAHGYWLATGEMQAVMVHVNVGLANTVMGVLNAASDNVPVLALSGRTPLTEAGRFGGRVTPIQYAQEMFDQTSLVREAVKFDYEIRYPEQCDTIAVRAAAIARSDPGGPVYVSLPREPLAESLPENFSASAPIRPAEAPAPGATEMARLAEWIDTADAPLVICQRGDPHGRLSRALSTTAHRLGLAVSEPFTIRNVIKSDDPALLGYGPDAAEAADLVIVLDSGVPWIPNVRAPRADARIVHAGPDPLFEKRPVRGYRSDLTITADPAAVLDAVAGLAKPNPGRQRRVAEASRLWRRRVSSQVQAPDGDEMSTPEWLSRCVSDVMDLRAIAFNELGLVPGAMQLQGPNRLFTNPHSGGLGWGLPAALGGQLADPDRLVFATMGDGSYMFANPTACHQIAEALNLPIITLVLNNEEWGAVRHSVEGLYRDGLAPKANDVPLTRLQPSPDFCKTAEASRAYTEAVTEGRELPAALERAIKVATEEKRQVLLNIAIARASP